MSTSTQQRSNSDIREEEFRELGQYVMLGIRMTLKSRPDEDQSKRPVHWKDFKEAIKLDLPSGPGTYARYRFKEYAPRVFQSIRQRFGISKDHFSNSLCCEESLMMMPTPGKSGSKFFWSSDCRYVMKTMAHSESLFLRKILFSYYQHMMANPHSLLTWFVSHYRIDRNGHKTYLMVMRNVFDTPLKIHEQYDLKGSTHGREVAPAKRNDPAVTWKDKDILRRRGHQSIKLGSLKKSALMAQLVSDVNFLASESTTPMHLKMKKLNHQFLPLASSTSIGLDEIDLDLEPHFPYLSVSYLAQGPKAPAFIGPTGLTTSMFQMEDGGFASTSEFPHAGSRYSISIQKKKYSNLGKKAPPRRTLPLTPEVERKFSVSSNHSTTSLEDGWIQPIFISPPQNPTRKPSVSDNSEVEGDSDSDVGLGDSINPLHGFLNLRNRCKDLAESDERLPTGNEVYFFGVIDILQKYNAKKKIESSAKSIFTRGNTISAIAPDQYARRFISFLDDIFG
ncbi:hypothetical protein GEMRC1_011553 [Eukaryota sp. GEM-RC1]